MKYKSGLITELSGTMGNITGSTWKGISYLKNKPGKSKKAKSLKQETQQLKFKTVMAFLSPLSDLLKITFRNGQAASGINNAMSHTFENALTGEYPDFTIDYPLVRISRGKLPIATAPPATVNGTEITFTWVNNAGTGTAAETDKAVLVAYCPALKLALFRTNTANRATTTATLDVSQFAGQEVHTYLAFITEDELKSSDSVYTGKLNLVL